MSVKYKPISIKIGGHVPQGTLNKAMQKVPTSPKICANTTLGNLRWQIEPSTQYLHLHFNESLNSHKTTGSYCLQKRQTCNKSRHLYIICSKCLPPAWTQASKRWRHVANRTFNEQCDSYHPLVFDASSQFVNIWNLSSCWRRTYRACSVKMM